MRFLVIFLMLSGVLGSPMGLTACSSVNGRLPWERSGEAADTGDDLKEWAESTLQPLIRPR